MSAIIAPNRFSEEVGGRTLPMDARRSCSNACALEAMPGTASSRSRSPGFGAAPLKVEKLVRAEVTGLGRYAPA